MALHSLRGFRMQLFMRLSICSLQHFIYDRVLWYHIAALSLYVRNFEEKKLRQFVKTPRSICVILANNKKKMVISYQFEQCSRGIRKLLQYQ
jgi:hypothetical protein